MISGFDRRRFLQTGCALTGAALLPGSARASDAPQLAQGLQIGDLSAGRALIWSRADRPARMWVDYALDPDFSRVTRIRGPHALLTSDYTARLDLAGLPPDRDIYVRVQFQDLSNERILSEPVTGRFRTPPAGRAARDLRFLWGGDTAGQGWGINPEFGGMKIYETMRLAQPDFFIHSGDTIYADGPIQEFVTAEGGRVWHNVVTPAVSKVAETLPEFRGRYLYNLLDDNVRRFNAEVPQIWQWDDHEVVNNWSDSKDLSGDSRYTEKNVPTLIARGARAFLEYAPMRFYSDVESERVYRELNYGPLLDVFVVDMRSYRGPNTYNLQTEPGAETAFFGAEQLAWLKRRLRASRAVWKVIAADMPIGLQIPDGVDAQGRPRFEGLSNGNSEVLGREFEMADLLADLRRAGIRNVVWLTADVHYCAAHFYNPEKARFKDFDGFWEFVSGPLNAGSFGPNALDDTFGPQVVFQKVPAAPNLSPYAGLQFFGQVDLDARTARMTVSLRDLDGQTVYSQNLQPQGDWARLLDLR
jgi:alkaline phosphatase D